MSVTQMLENAHVTQNHYTFSNATFGTLEEEKRQQKPESKSKIVSYCYETLQDSRTRGII
uniref:Uncharacterized protein n=1 Tax=Rhizophora mucronata TaxID=61149 RepID=A0A2P2P4B7_RHIMU